MGAVEAHDSLPSITPNMAVNNYFQVTSHSQAFDRARKYLRKKPGHRITCFILSEIIA